MQLLLVWEKIREKHYLKKPTWLSTTEALAHPNIINTGNITRYKGILSATGELKAKQELDVEGIEMKWYTRLQIQSRYKKEAKLYGFFFFALIYMPPFSGDSGRLTMC